MFLNAEFTPWPFCTIIRAFSNRFSEQHTSSVSQNLMIIF
jgi:hypothetical protein